MHTHTAHWKPLVVLLVAAAFLPGCILELLTTTAIQGELQAQNAAAATQQLAHAQRMADEMKIRQGIDVYRADHGENPPSLQALVPRYLDAVPVDPAGQPLYAYDPATGWFGPRSESTAPSATPDAITAQDETNLAALETALYDYHAMYQSYPAQLSDLAPRFIDAVPTLPSGRSYTYFSDTGEVYHPSELQAAASAPTRSRGSSAPISGGSPAAEQMQAIGIMNDLNAGANPNTGRARRQATDVGAQQNERYENVLNDLDL